MAARTPDRKSSGSKRAGSTSKTSKPNAASKRPARRAPARRGTVLPKSILVVDIGGTSIKFLATGETEVRRIASGRDMTPVDMVRAVKKRAADWKYAAVSVGYPGLVGQSGPVAEPGNLGPGWVGFDFGAAFGCPARVVNDATMQALGSYHGGRMLFLGFGTGIGSVLISNQSVVPLELGELRFKGGTLWDHLGRAALEKVGKRRWRQRVLDVIPSMQRAFLADYVVLGGGNSEHLLEPLPPNVRIGHNLTAFLGGHRLWGVDSSQGWSLDDSQKALAASVGNWRLL